MSKEYGKCDYCGREGIPIRWVDVGPFVKVRVICCQSCWSNIIEDGE